MTGGASQRDAWTVVVGASGGPGAETVFVIPSHVAFDAALHRWRPQLESVGPPVRIVALGATLKKSWPDWLHTVPRLVSLTELDAYLPEDRATLLAEIRPQLEAWLDRVFADTLPGSRGTKAFWSAACQRFFDDVNDAWLLACGLDAAHPEDAIVCADPAWAGYRILADRRARGGHPLPGPPRSRIRRWLLPFLTTGGSLLAMARRAREFLAEAPARAELLRRRELQSCTRPNVFIAVTGAWPRASRPVVEIIPPLARHAHERLGALLLHTLEPGLRRSEAAGDLEPGPIFPVLDAEPLDGLVAVVEQAVSVETPGALARVFAESLGSSVRAAFRALERPVIGTTAIDWPLVGLARLLTMDVLRVREAVTATRALLARCPMDGATIVYPHATQPNDAAGIQLLEAAGATTVELLHGIVDVQWQLGRGRTATSVKAFWSVPEAERLAPLEPAQRCLGGYFPRALPAKVVRARPRPDEPVRVLVTSNYLPNAWGVSARFIEHYQQPLLRAVLEARHGSGTLAIRWRPHPGDDPRRVEEMLRQFPELERSPVTDLDGDLRWAHLLVTSLSSVILEALFYELPIFVHDVPRWDSAWLRAVAPERRFGHAQPLASVLPACVASLRSGDDRTLAPEVALHRQMFGASGQPRSLADLLFAERASARTCVR